MTLSSYLLILLLFVVSKVNGGPLVPAMFVFGDSVFDVGNNNNLFTVIKANFPPYGRDFVNHQPTGRFCNGKTSIDIIAELLGFTSYSPAYLSQDATGKNLLNGVNFASAGSGYFWATPKLYNAISLNQQVENYKDVQKQLVEIVGQSNVSSIVNGSIHLISCGSSDYIQNYYINPVLKLKYTPDQFSDVLIQSFTKFIQNLYNIGARKIGVTTLPPIGCLPAARTLFGPLSNTCVETLNKDAIAFNNKLNTTAQGLVQKLPGLKLVVFDIFLPLYELVTKPAEKGFMESRRACCGSGLIETSILCNSLSPGTCANASEYVFWDGFHPTQAANQVLANDLLVAGISLIS